MKCKIHNLEMEYGGEAGNGQDIWICEECEYRFDVLAQVCPDCRYIYEFCVCYAFVDDEDRGREYLQ